MKGTGWRHWQRQGGGQGDRLEAQVVLLLYVSPQTLGARSPRVGFVCVHKCMSTCMCLHWCVFSWMHMPMSAHVCGRQRSTSNVILQSLSTLVLGLVWFGFACMCGLLMLV